MLKKIVLHKPLILVLSLAALLFPPLLLNVHGQDQSNFAVEAQAVPIAETLDFITPQLTTIHDQSELYQPRLSLRVEQQVDLIDKRAVMLDRFFASKNSPLAGHGATFIKYCDLYGAPHDCTAIPAIAFAESNYCEAPWSLSMHNCWGFGGSGGNRMKFDNFDQAIQLITDRLVNQYGSWFLQDPRKGSATYCGSNCPNWANAVESARIEINNFSINNGFGRLY